MIHPSQNFFRTLLIVILISVAGCGFHLRGEYDIPAVFQKLRILPDLPFDPLQHHLRLTLKTANICVIDNCLEEAKEASILTIVSQGFTERTTAYGPDVQINRATLQFTMVYHIVDKNGKVLIPASTIQVERELTVNPNALLGTEFERKRVREELYVDATLQLIRQISAMHHAPPC